MAYRLLHSMHFIEPASKVPSAAVGDMGVAATSASAKKSLLHPYGYISGFFASVPFLAPRLGTLATTLRVRSVPEASERNLPVCMPRTARVTISLAIPVFLLSVVAQHAQADPTGELHSCNGVYTNKPCEQVEADSASPLRPSKGGATTPLPTHSPRATSTAKAVIATPTSPILVAATPTSPNATPRVLNSPTVPPTSTAQKTPTPLPTGTSTSVPLTPTVNVKATAIAKGKKDVALHDLRTKLIKERKRLAIDLDISEAVEVCSSVSTTLDECKAVVRSLDDKLEERITNAALVKQNEAKAKSEATAVAAREVSKTSVVIVQPQVFPTSTPLYVFDVGPILPVDPKFRRGDRGPSQHLPSQRSPHDHPRDNRNPHAVEPQPNNSGMVDTVKKSR